MSVAEVIPAVSGDLALIVPGNPLAVLTDPKRFSEFYARVKAETDKHVPDTTTKRGRDAIRSLARKVVSTKTAIDAEGKRLNEDARAQINTVDAARRKIWDEMDALAKEVRAPLTKWEEAEDARQVRCAAVMDRLNRAGVILATETSSELVERLAEVQALEIAEEEFQELAAGARFARDGAVEALTAGIERSKAAEAERAELDRLRTEAAERARVEADRLLAERLEQERAAAEAARLERERAADERRRLDLEAAAETARQAEAERSEQARVAEVERLERAQREAAEAADAARLKAEREHAAELARVQGEADAREAEVRRQEEARQAEAERAAAEQRHRDADRKHRGEVMKAAKEALLAIDIDGVAISEPAAKAIVLAIVAGQVPHVSLRF